ncbi:MAG: acyl--CoA ligase [Acidimicrobiales bacterium]|nr:acyl--CoA ligase [Acidimicrobiales bacterium]
MLYSIADCIAANAVAFPHRVAIEELDPRHGTEPIHRLTYQEVWKAVCVVADAFGYVEPGPHGPMVAMLLPNGSTHVLGYLAAQIAGVTAVPLDVRRSTDELAYILRDCGASVLLSAGDALDEAHTLADRLGLRVLDVRALDVTGEHLWYAPGGRDSGRTPAVVAYTAGTTGFPKAMCWSNQEWLLRLFRSGWAFGLSPDHVISVPSPLSHVPFGGMVLGALTIGARVRIMTEFDADLAVEEYTRHSTWACLTPALLGAVTERWRERHRPSLDALRLLLSTGAGAVQLLDEAFDVFPRARITEAYGWIEGGWICHEVKDRAALVPHSVGWPIVGAEISIRSDSGLALADGEPGELVARTLVPFAGYLGEAPGATDLLTPDGFVRSGDIATRLEDGRVAIVGRTADRIIIAGRHVYAAEIERVLLAHPDIAEAAVFGLDGPKGRCVTAVVVPRRDARSSGATLTDDVLRHCRLQLDAHACPQVVLPMHSLPRTAGGQVLKYRLADALNRR